MVASSGFGLPGTPSEGARSGLLLPLELDHVVEDGAAAFTEEGAATPCVSKPKHLLCARLNGEVEELIEWEAEP